MTERHFYADVDLPFHVWVREQAGAPGFRWVLREASDLQQGPLEKTPAAATGRERPQACPGA